MTNKQPWHVGDVLRWTYRDSLPVYRKITEVRVGPYYSFKYCEKDGETYGNEHISENSNDQSMILWERVV